MKRLILSELLLLFLATTFVTDSLPPGWYQQTLPVNNIINDIYFLDSLNGWLATQASISDSLGYILLTTNSGSNWTVSYSGKYTFNAIQFLNLNTGYAGGGDGLAKFFKTTNGGTNWFLQASFGFITVKDLSFVNNDTGWICDDNSLNGGVFKTINGGINWQPELGSNFLIKKLFFINKDTGWAISNEANGKLYITQNGGTSWDLRYTFGTNLGSIYFISNDTGFVSGGFGTHSIKKTVNGGYNWVSTTNSEGGRGLFFQSNKLGWNSDVFSIIQKSTDGGLNWFNQTVPSGYYYSIQFADSSRGWSGGTILIHTTDGGGPPEGIIKTNITVSGFKLNQNYPNPFNPVTLIFFDLPEDSRVDLIIYNILGEEVSELLDDEFFTAGTVQFGFNADKEGLSSGVYFYRLIARPEEGKEIFIDTKKMILLK